MSFQKFRKECERLVGKVEVPPKDIRADLAFPCFNLAKEQKKNPAEIAKELENTLKKKHFTLIKEVRAAGPYLNFYINYEKFSPSVIKEIMKQKEKYGSSDEGQGKVVIVEYSSPNIAKPLTIGHLSTTIMGDALYRVFSFLGYRAISDNHIGDWGTQFGKLMYAYKKWGDKTNVEKNPIEELLALYVRFHKEAELDPKLDEEAREWFKRLEEGNKEAVALWKWFANVSMKEFGKLYKRLGIGFDYTIGESFYVPVAKEIINETLRKKIAKQEGDAVIVTFDDMPTIIIQKSDETTLYQTRDLATIKYQKKKFKFWKRLYVVGSEQKLYFRQVFRIAETLGYIKQGDCIHVDVGQISLPTGRISTRRGNIIFMEDVVNKAAELAESILKEKNPKLGRGVAEKIAIGAIKYSNLSRDRVKDMVFDLDAMLSFEGDTGPYLQYTYARANSILRKSCKKISKKPKLSQNIEFGIIKKLSQFNDIVRKSSDEYKPNILANYLFELASMFNEFYHSVKVIGEKEEQDRLALVVAVMHVIENGCRLLGIEVLKEM